MKINILNLMDEIINNIEKIKNIDYDFAKETEIIFTESVICCLNSNNESIKNIYETLKKLKNL